MVLTADAQAIETKHLGFTISPHEECGVEEAVRIVEAGGGEVVVLTLGPEEAAEQIRDCMAIGADRGIHLVTVGGVGRAGDRGCDRRGDPRRGAVRPDRVRQRVGGRGRLPGRDPRRVRARPAGRHRAEGADGRRRARALRAGGAGRARRLRRPAAGGRDGEGGPEPAALSVGAGEAAREVASRWTRVPSSARRRGSRSCASSCRRARASRRRSSARAPAAAPRVVEVMQQLGVA